MSISRLFVLINYLSHIALGLAFVLSIQNAAALPRTLILPSNEQEYVALGSYSCRSTTRTLGVIRSRGIANNQNEWRQISRPAELTRFRNQIQVLKNRVLRRPDSSALRTQLQNKVRARQSFISAWQNCRSGQTTPPLEPTAAPSATPSASPTATSTPAPGMPTATPTPTPTPWPALASCTNGLDEDADGLIDLDDLDCFGPNQSEDPTPDGWTRFSPSIDSRIVYVSSSEGNNANSGLSPAQAKASIAAGIALLRSGSPDWLLLKRGDTWNESLGGSWTKSGRSISEPLLISSYGQSSQRPIIALQSGGGFTFVAFAGNSPATLHAIALSGLHFLALDPTGLNTSAGFYWLGGGSDLLIEDCKFDGFKSAVSIQGYTGVVEGASVRRNIMVNSFSANSHSQGIFANTVNDLVLEDNFFDHNGWNEEVPEAEATIFNHNMYINNGCGPAIIKNNIVMRASSHGIQLRGGGTIEDNIFIQNPLAILVGGGTVPDPEGVSGTVVNNVILEGNNISPTLPRGFGIDLKNLNHGEIYGNIVANKISQTHSFAIGGPISGGPTGIGLWNTDIHDNIIYNWPGSLNIGEPMNGSQYISNNINDNTIVDKLSWSASTVLRLPSVDPAQFILDSNRYFTLRQPDRWFQVGTTFYGYNQWTSQLLEQNSSVGEPNFKDPTRSGASYAAHIGLAENLDALSQALQERSRVNWPTELTSQTMGDYFRDGFTEIP